MNTDNLHQQESALHKPSDTPALSPYQQWLSGNTAYLSTAVRWVQLRLERYIDDLVPAHPLIDIKAPISRRISWFGSRQPEPLKHLHHSKHRDSLNATLEQLATELSVAENAASPPALIMLSRQLGLTGFERDILLLCAALELDGKTAALCARAQPSTHKPYPTFALALQLFEQPAWDALSPQRPLRYWRLLDINQPGAEPLATSALRADERIVNYLVEPKQVLDDRLLPFILGIQPSAQDELLAPSQVQLAQRLQDYLQRQTETRNLVVQLTGNDHQAKAAITRTALRQLGLDMVRFALENLPAQTAELENLLRLWNRERLLLPVVFYLDTHNADDSVATKNLLQRILATAGGLVIIASTDPQPDVDGFSLAITKPEAAEQRAAWSEVLESHDPAFASQLAGQFSLDITSIQQIGARAAAEAGENPDQQMLHNIIWQECLVKTSPRLDQLAQRLELKATWDQLVLPADSLTLLQQITAQVDQRTKVYEDWGFQGKMNRGTGLSALFAGESGTGKTMAAEVIANALNLNLYRIDLSAVVSKYIGETEKNLRRLFDAAEDGGAILFFDEADALFGKRSDVKDSHDRYANIEINYLLQRIEAYRGLAILATNMKSALDQAFMRRLRFIVNFSFPAAAQRAELWRKVFPPQTPVAELDYQHLARFNLTGGSIHNIALNAAFLAARNNHPQITMALIFEAIRGELRKLDKPVNEAEFRLLGVAGARP